MVSKSLAVVYDFEGSLNENMKEMEFKMTIIDSVFSEIEKNLLNDPVAVKGCRIYFLSKKYYG